MGFWKVPCLGTGESEKGCFAVMPYTPSFFSEGKYPMVLGRDLYRGKFSVQGMLFNPVVAIAQEPYWGPVFLRNRKTARFQKTNLPGRNPKD